MKFMPHSRLPISFQDPASPIMEGIIDLHNHIFFYLILIFVFVFTMFAFIMKQFWHDQISDQTVESLELRQDLVSMKNIVHGTQIELIWTIIPSIILAFIAVPSFALLYAMDEMIDPALTIKIIGRQWYWVYEYSDFNTYEEPSITFDSYMIPEADLTKGSLRLLEVDNPIYLPTNTHIRLIITANDVLHSWAVPSLGIKTDAVPGRLNQASLFIKREGVYYGQCSELCGVNHGFMPIVVNGIEMDKFLYLMDIAKK
jgi:cytochrome c oxidase subunit 2